IAAIPAERPLARGFGDRLHRQPDMLALLLAGEQGHVLPAIAVADDVVAALADRARGLAVALERHGADVEGALDVVLVEDVHQPPEANARAALVHCLHGEIALAARPRPPRRFRETVSA